MEAALRDLAAGWKSANPDDERTAEQPGELDGHGTIPATLARALVADPTGTWRRLLTDDHQRLIDVSAHTYRPPQPSPTRHTYSRPTDELPRDGTSDPLAGEVASAAW
jgi:hypothetical protein